MGCAQPEGRLLLAALEVVRGLKVHQGFGKAIHAVVVNSEEEVGGPKTWIQAERFGKGGRGGGESVLQMPHQTKTLIALSTGRLRRKLFVELFGEWEVARLLGFLCGCEQFTRIWILGAEQTRA